MSTQKLKGVYFNLRKPNYDKLKALSIRFNTSMGRYTRDIIEEHLKTKYMPKSVDKELLK